MTKIHLAILDTKPLTSGALPPLGMCTSSTARIFDGYIPLLRYMHLVSRMDTPASV